MLLQGGYYASTTCTVGIVGCIALVPALVLRWKAKAKVSLSQLCMPAAFVIIGLLALVGTWANDLLTISAVPKIAAWFMLAGLALFPCVMDGGQKRLTLKIIRWVGVALSAVGVLMMSGALSVYGAVNAGRLQFTFQYANAAGAWFAVVSILCLCACGGSESPKTEKVDPIIYLTPLPTTALLLTGSAGASLLFLIACVFMPVLWRKKEDAAVRTVILISSVALAALSFAASKFVSMSLAPLWAVCAVATHFAVCKAIAKALDKSNNKERTFGLKPHVRRVLAVVAILICVLVAIACALALTDRLYQASQTFIERLVQIKDGAALLGGAQGKGLLLGIGVGGWEQSYPFVQSAQYTASRIHCSYLGVALDAGLVALAIMLVAITLRMREIVRTREIGPILAASFLLMHFLIDFDVAFSSILLLLAFLLSMGPNASDTTETGGKPALNSRFLSKDASAAAVSICCIVAIACGALGEAAESAITKVDDAFGAGDADAACETRASTPLAESDIEVNTACIKAFRNAGRHDDAASFAEAAGIANAEQAALVAESLFMQGKNTEAGELLVDWLEDEPRNVNLFDAANALFSSYGVDGSVAERYHEAIRLANEPTTGIASLLGNQKQIEEVAT